MAFCSKCGAQLNDNAKFCPACGATTGAAQQQQTYQQPQQPTGQGDAYRQYTGNNNANTGYNAAPNTTYTNTSSSDDTIMGIFAYLWVLVLIPIFAAKDSRFARFHANQGLTLCIIEVAWYVVSAILNAIFIAILAPALVTIISIVGWLLSLGFLALVIIGIVNVCNKQMKPLPVIGDMLHIIK